MELFATVSATVPFVTCFPSSVTFFPCSVWSPTKVTPPALIVLSFLVVAPSGQNVIVYAAFFDAGQAQSTVGVFG